MEFKKVLGWKEVMDGQMPDFKDVAFGHWHQLYQQEFNGITVRCSGSTESKPLCVGESSCTRQTDTKVNVCASREGWTTVEYPAVRLGTKE